ncbi:histone H2A.Z-specific chaperone CHZ1-like [Canna indica]|uniref:Histone H2A.Z-specific chaperone CHZ1-like n=1 Tax=Canna indica TaxID=4628 RepID=A0AAQ3K2S8_9LILI|nr:histone H2A.Z-specific chaperone CHZ1-like [Canna indica]
MSMAETNGEPKSQTVEPESSPLPPPKRKCDAQSLEEGEGEQTKKHQKLVIASDPLPQPEDPPKDDAGQGEATEEDAGLNGNVKGKGVLTAVDKGKGILVEEEREEEEEEDDEDSDDSSDVGSGDEIGGDGDDDSDYVDDPLAEVDLDNILPSRTRRRDPPPPGAFFDPEQDENDSDDSE